LCDDHVLLAEALDSLLRVAGHEVTVTSTPTRALELLADGGYEICVLDIGFPDANGLDVLSSVAEVSPDTRVLILSANRDPEVVRAAVDRGAAGYVCKDVGVVEVIRAVDRVHDGELVLDPLVARALAQRPRIRREDIEWLVGFLTRREREVLRRIVAGQSTEEMAHDMRVSRSTARTHVQNVLQKLGVHSRLQAMAAVSRHPRGIGWLSGADQELRHTQ
jgi:two-component system, NarL family, nitrate/nitrite response regulator NarL